MILDGDAANVVISVVPLAVVVEFYVLIILPQPMVIVAMTDVMRVFGGVMTVKMLGILAVDRVV